MATVPGSTVKGSDSSTPKEGPDWFAEEAAKLGAEINSHPEKIVFEGLVGSSLEQIYLARQAFSEDSRSALSNNLVVFSAGAGLLLAPYGFQAFGGTIVSSLPFNLIEKVCHLLSVAVFLVGVPINRILSRKIDAGYDLYVAAAVHAAFVFEALKLPATHRWLINVKTCLTKRGKFTPTDREWGDGWVFTNCSTACSTDNPASRIGQPHSIGTVLAVWQSLGPNLHRSYKALFLALIIFCSVMTLVSGFFVAKDFRLVGQDTPEKASPGTNSLSVPGTVTTGINSSPRTVR